MVIIILQIVIMLTHLNIPGKSNYGVQISSFIKKDNFYGVQFHPEKSSKQGKKFLKFFLDQV